MTKPVIGITMGDAAGIGPEIIVKALSTTPALHTLCHPLVIGDAEIMRRAARVLGVDTNVQAVQDMRAVSFNPNQITLLDLQNLPLDLPFGRVDARAGKAAYEYIACAVELALKHQLAALVTAPLNKEALHLAGCHFPGHTEILAHLSGTEDYAMLLAGGKLKVIHVSTHASLRQACDLVTYPRVLQTIKLANTAAKLLGHPQPRIAVAGLNPHAGEGGLFGAEEREQIAPAVSAAKDLGLNVTGPIAPDTAFYRAAVKGDFDIVVAMYHDQGHIPLKVLDFETGVNVTVGLPFIRTSVDHGTAFDKAGRGTADSRSMVEALLLAIKMAQNVAENP